MVEFLCYLFKEKKTHTFFLLCFVFGVFFVTEKVRMLQLLWDSVVSIFVFKRQLNKNKFSMRTAQLGYFVCFNSPGEVLAT